MNQDISMHRLKSGGAVLSEPCRACILHRLLENGVSQWLRQLQAGVDELGSIHSGTTSSETRPNGTNAPLLASLS